MSLDWSVSKVKNHESMCWTRDEGTRVKRLAPITEMIVWGAMAVGIGGINRANVDEWNFRCEYARRIGCTWWDRRNPETGQVEGVVPTREEIIAHIGLRTNVTTETRRQWIRRMARWLEREVESQVRIDTDRAEQLAETA